MRRPIIWGLVLVLALVVPVAAQRVFVSTVVIGMSTRAANTYTFSPVPIPPDVKGLQLTMDVSEAPDPPTALPEISASLECSLDGGTSWVSAGAFTRIASPKSMNRQKTQLLQTISAGFLGGDCWNATQNNNRVLRGNATIGGSLRFALTVQPL